MIQHNHNNIINNSDFKKEIRKIIANVETNTFVAIVLQLNVCGVYDGFIAQHFLHAIDLLGRWTVLICRHISMTFIYLLYLIGYHRNIPIEGPGGTVTR